MENPIRKLANLIVHFSTKIQPEENVLLSGPVEALPLLDLIYEECIKAGAHVSCEFSESDNMISSFYAYANQKQLTHVPEWVLSRLEQTDVHIMVYADTNTKASTNMDLNKQNIYDNASRAYNELWDERTNEKQMRWCLTLFPTNAYAQDAEMSIYEYQDMFYRACKLNYKDPIVQWKKIKKYQQTIIDYLSDKSRIHILAPGTDLKLRTKNRPWINCFGEENLPDGEIYTSPIEHSINGKIYFPFPTVFEGREIEGIKLTFKNGKVTHAQAKKNEEFLLNILDRDEGARRIGEFAFGLNSSVYIPTKDVLFDEKMGGTCHLALGSSYENSGGKNKSSIHWDMICDLRQNAKVYVDERLFLKDGEILVQTP